MQYGEENPTRNTPNNTPPIFFKDNAVAIYTLLAILLKIRSTMGLEAMLEYIEHYQKLIERFNPDFKVAVKAALAMMSVEKMYRDITTNEKP